MSGPTPIDPRDIDWDQELTTVRRERGWARYECEAAAEERRMAQPRTCKWCRRDAAPRARYCPSCRRYIGPGQGTPEAREDAERADKDMKGAIWTVVGFIAFVGGCSALISKSSKNLEREAMQSQPERSEPQRMQEWWDPNNPSGPARRVRLEDLPAFAEWRECSGR